MISILLSYFIRHLGEYGLDQKTAMWITTDESDGVPVVNLDYETETLVSDPNRLITDVNKKIDTNQYVVEYWTMMGDSVNISVKKRGDESWKMPQLYGM